MSSTNWPALFWGCSTGISGALLLGNLFATYQELRTGIFRLLMVLAIGFAAFTVFTFAQARAADPSIQFDWKPIIALAAVVFLLLWMGGGQ